LGTLRGGGDGTQKEALTIAKEIEFVEKTFGFDTAVVKASEAVAAAHMEAHSQINPKPYASSARTPRVRLRFQLL
ncbi:MAG: hypothetical protein WBH66_09080, partial [Rectinemataceae bacterium]